MKSQFLKFIFIGVFCTLINYFIFYVLYRFLNTNYLAAYCIGFMFGVCAGYFANKHWTFKVQDSRQVFWPQYLSVYTASLLLGLGLLKFLVETCNIVPEIANLLNIGFTTLTNFFGIKWWVFKK